jgi:hypothetical protein
MVTGTELRDSWTCGACRVTSRNPRVGPSPMPPRWDRDDDGRPRCVACSRAANGIDPDDKRARRQRASAAAHQRQRIEREEGIADVLRALSPAEGPEAVAEAMEATGSGRQKVEEVRRALRASGDLPPARGRGKRAEPSAASAEKATKGKRIEEALRRDHRRTDAEVAAELGVAASTVYAARRRIGLRWDSKAAARDATHAALVRLGEVDHVAVGGELGIDPETARQRLNVLARAGRVGKRRNGRGVLYRAA